MFQTVNRNLRAISCGCRVFKSKTRYPPCARHRVSTTRCLGRPIPRRKRFLPRVSGMNVRHSHVRETRHRAKSARAKRPRSTGRPLVVVNQREYTDEIYSRKYTDGIRRGHVVAGTRDTRANGGRAMVSRGFLWFFFCFASPRKSANRYSPITRPHAHVVTAHGRAEWRYIS